MFVLLFLKMHKFVLLFLMVAALFSNCGPAPQDRNEKLIDNASEMPDTSQLLTQYWELKDADNPTSRDISFTADDGAEYASGIVFMADSTVLENPVGEMTYGKYDVKGNTISVNFDDKRKVINRKLSSRLDMLARDLVVYGKLIRKQFVNDLLQSAPVNTFAAYYKK